MRHFGSLLLSLLLLSYELENSLGDSLLYLDPAYKCVHTSQLYIHIIVNIIESHIYIYIYIYIYITHTTESLSFTPIYRDTLLRELYNLCCVHYLCLRGWIYVFYVGHIDKILKPFSTL
jgi:hypothetical protein